MSVDSMLLHGPFPEIKKLKLDELRGECEMWRNMWGWVPYGIKEFLVHSGQQVGVVRRDYRRWLGVLLSTEWELKSLDIGTAEKVYDSETGKYFFEKKIVKLQTGQIIGFEWISERVAEDDLVKEEEKKEEITAESELNH